MPRIKSPTAAPAARISARSAMLEQKCHIDAPVERVHLIILEPLLCTALNNKYICPCHGDQFINRIDCIPLPSQTAEVTATATVNGFFGRFRCPFQIFSERGGTLRVSYSGPSCAARSPQSAGHPVPPVRQCPEREVHLHPHGCGPILSKLLG